MKYTTRTRTTRRKATLFSLAAAAGMTLLAGAAARPAAADVNVVATTPELAAISKEVGGSLVSVTSLAKPNQDYHKVEAKPTDVVKVKNAQVFVRVGMDMDMWADSVMNAARNPQVQPGGKGYVDAGRLIRKKEVPTASISGASGDVHVYGNPHYWLDPANAKVVAYEVDLGLRAVDPKNATTYDANYAKFSADIDKHMAEWRAELAPFKGRPVVAYHDEWVYFLGEFGLRAFGYLEPKPGIPPSGAHVSQLITAMKQDGVKAVIIPSIYPSRFGDLVAKETGGHVATVPYSVSSQAAGGYVAYMDAIVNGFKQAMQ